MKIAGSTCRRDGTAVLRNRDCCAADRDVLRNAVLQPNDTPATVLVARPVPFGILIRITAGGTPRDLERIFEPFYRIADRAIAIARGITASHQFSGHEAHGGGQARKCAKAAASKFD